MYMGLLPDAQEESGTGVGGGDGGCSGETQQGQEESGTNTRHLGRQLDGIGGGGRMSGWSGRDGGTEWSVARSWEVREILNPQQLLLFVTEEREVFRAMTMMIGNSCRS